VQLSTTVRAQVAERICDALAFLHRHGIVASDIAPNNLLVAFRLRGPAVCFIDCDSMVFRGQQALAAVETGDWQIPAAFGEPPQTRAADAYKLGLLILRLFARSHDAHTVMSRPQCVPTELHGLLRRALGPDAANRPPAGEWQRALRQLLSAGALDVRYPGPEPRDPAPMRSAAAAPMRSVGSAPMRSAGAAPSRSSIPAHRRASAGRPPLRPARGQPPSTRRSRGRHDAVTFAWMVVAAVVFVIILARLAAAAVPSPAGGGFAPGPSGGGAPSGAFQYYYHGAFSPGPP